jgi:chemotaxis regulatin CheY-phosphate phosphatase CheZ
MNSTLPFDGARASSALPYLSANQTQALLKSAAAISCELLSGSFDTIAANVRESLTGRWDFDIGAPLVQRVLMNRANELRQAFLKRVPEHQDQMIAELLVVKTGAQVAPVDMDSMALVQQVDDAVDSIAARPEPDRRLPDGPLFAARR